MRALVWAGLVGVFSSGTIFGAALPLRFETDNTGALISRNAVGALRLDRGGMTVMVRDASGHRAVAVTTRFLGGNPDVRPEGDGLMAARANYLLGSDARAWRTGAALYERAVYRHVYRGIDLVFHGSGGALEYDFVVAPGVDSNQIGMEVGGASSLRIGADGALAIGTAAGEIRWKAPVVYQVKNGARQLIAGRFTRRGRRIGFALGSYDRTRPLVIDPTLVYASYLGGSNNEGARGVAADTSGNFYITGFTFSTNLPVTGGSLQTAYHGGTAEVDLGGDAFVAKFSSSGALVYVTYLGGRADDAGTAVAVDSAGNAYVTGYTASTDFPTTTGAFQTTFGGAGAEKLIGASFGDAFVAKLNPNGNALIYSTYLGGKDEDKATAIAIDSAGNAYVGGATLSTNFPTANAAQGSFKGSGGIPDLCSGCGPIENSGDGFVAKLKPDGSGILYSTYLGGALDDAVTAIAVDSGGIAYAGGATLSKDFPTTTGAYQTTFGGGATLNAQPVLTTGDGFVTSLDASGKIFYSTYLGGSGDDAVMGIAADGTGAAYVTGFTSSANFPITAKAAQSKFGGPATITGLRGFVWGDAFVTKIAPKGGSLAYSTFLGGSADDAGMAIALDASGNAYVGGFANSSKDFPITTDALQKMYGGTRPNQTDDTGDGFLAKVNADGSSFVYSSYYGGANDEVVTGVAVDAKGNVYLGGLTTSTNLTTTGGAAQPKFGGENANFQTETYGDAFVAVVSGLVSTGPVITSVVNGFSFGNAIAPGGVAAVFGTNLPASTSAGATVNGAAATVLAATATQWLILIPGNAPVGPATITVGASAPFNVTLSRYAPALSTGPSTVTATHADNSVVTTASPASTGETITLYATGLGAVDSNNVVQGAVSVTIGGATAQVVSAVAASGLPGTYQVTVVVPFGLSSGNQNVVLSIGGANSAPAPLPVKAVAPPTGPVISAVENGATFQPGIAANTWVTIAGINLAPQTDFWENFIVNGKLPTSLDGVTVTIGGQQAYVRYISSTQINAVAPNVPAGPATVVVTSSLGTSASFNTTVQSASPGFFLWPGSQAVATRQDFSLAVKNGTFAGVTTIAAKPGDVIILWGTGFGPSSPAVPFGVVVPNDTTYFSANPVTVTLAPVGGGAATPATVFGAALAPGFPALYQVAIQIPSSLADGDYSIVSSVSGIQSPASALLTVQH